jgi:hypothetical protein
MSNPVLPGAIDLSTDGASGLEAAIAFSVLGLIGLLLLIGKWRVEYRNLPDDQQRHAKALIGQLESQTPTSLSWRPSELTAGDYGRQTVRDALEATPGTDVQADRATMSQAAREISAAWSTGIQSLTQRLPALAVRLLTLAGGIVVLGPVAVYALDRWRAAAQGGSGLELAAVVDALADITTTFASEATGLITSFPYFGDLWGLALATAILTWQTVYAHPLVTAAVLVVTALVVAVLDRRLVTTDDLRRDSVSVVTAPRVVAATVGVWALGVGPTAVGTIIGYPSQGATVGVIVAFLGALGAVAWTVREFTRALRREARLQWPSDTDRIVAAWLVSKRIATALVGIGAVLVPAYLINVVVSGRLLAVAGILASARIEVQALIAVVVVLGLGIAAYRARDAWPDLRVALGDLTKDRGVKLALFGSGMPFVALAAVYFLTESTTGSTPIALAFALIAGVAVRGGYMLLRAIRYKASLLEGDDRAPLRVVDHCYRVTDADGRTHYVVRVNGTELAHRDPDALADAVADAHRDVVDPDADGIRASVAKQYARHLRELGIVHVETADDNTPSTMKKLKAEMERRTYGGLEQNGRQMRVRELEDLIGDLPEDVVEEELTRYEIEGTRNGNVLIDNGYVWLV